MDEPRRPGWRVTAWIISAAILLAGWWVSSAIRSRSVVEATADDPTDFEEESPAEVGEGYATDLFGLMDSHMAEASARILSGFKNDIAGIPESLSDVQQIAMATEALEGFQNIVRRLEEEAVENSCSGYTELLARHPRETARVFRTLISERAAENVLPLRVEGLAAYSSRFGEVSDRNGFTQIVPP